MLLAYAEQKGVSCTVKYTWFWNTRVAWLSVILLFSLTLPAIAQEGAQVYILPPAEAPGTGQPMTVDVVAEGVSNLYGAEIHLNFDPNAVRLEDADPQQDGVQLTPGSFLDPTQGFVVANTSDNEAGTAVFAVTLVNPALPVEGSGVIAQVTFVPLRPGALQLGLEKVKLVTRDLQTLDVSLSGLEMQVSDQAFDPADWADQRGEITPTRTATSTRGVSIWMLALVALAVVSIPLAGACFIFVREVNRQPWPNNTP
jgi:hypothetical protein